MTYVTYYRKIIENEAEDPDWGSWSLTKIWRRGGSSCVASKIRPASCPGVGYVVVLSLSAELWGREIGMLYLGRVEGFLNGEREQRIRLSKCFIGRN
jgi:hypothetical protein